MPKGIKNWKEVGTEQFESEMGHTWVDKAWRNKETGELVTIESNPEYVEGESTYEQWLTFVYPSGKRQGGKQLGEVDKHHRAKRLAKEYMKKAKTPEMKRLNPPTDEEPPFTIDIVWEGGSGTDSNVETWHYEGNTLYVQYTNGDSVEYPVGNVVEVH